MTETACRQVATAVIRDRGQLLLVRQRLDGYTHLTWSLPGGVVEAGELLTEALRREVREETGMMIRDITGLAYLLQLHRPTKGEVWTVTAFEARCRPGTPRPADPDNQVTAARFLPLETARSMLQGQVPLVMSEPLLSYLDLTAPAGSAWFYRESGGGETDLVDYLTAADAEGGRLIT